MRHGKDGGMGFSERWLHIVPKVQVTTMRETSLIARGDERIEIVVKLRAPPDALPF